VSMLSTCLVSINYHEEPTQQANQIVYTCVPACAALCTLEPVVWSGLSHIKHVVVAPAAGFWLWQCHGLQYTCHSSISAYLQLAVHWYECTGELLLECDISSLLG
jgi:hypothetical protein